METYREIVVREVKATARTFLRCAAVVWLAYAISELLILWARS